MPLIKDWKAACLGDLVFMSEAVVSSLSILISIPALF